jgi:hypothetical protein
MRTRIPLSRWAAPLLLCVSASAQAPLGELFAVDPGAPAATQPAGTGMAVLPGSELSAGIAAATLKLSRGGQMRICSRTHLSVNNGGQGLMLGMDTGAIEIDFRLPEAVVDLVVTPDFSIRLAGPAVYHFALGVTNRGDTCFKPLPENSGGVFFSELLGSNVLASKEAVVFSGGKLSRHTSLTDPCGCLEAVPVQRASAAPETPSGQSGDAAATRMMVVNTDVGLPAPTNQTEHTHVEVETPFVFSARSATAAPGMVAKVEFSSLPNMFFVQEEPDPIVLVVRPPELPAQEAKPSLAPAAAARKEREEKKGFLAHLKGFFSSLFHH